MEPSTILASLLCFGLGACGLYWTIAIARFCRVIGQKNHVRQGLSLPMPPHGWPSISIVVPVHNEERVIDRCLVSLRDQAHPAIQIVVVMDRCTDRTESIVRDHAARDSRIIPVVNDSCPPDWAGKCNAARIGAERATGEWLLFTDADTWLAPDLACAAQAIALRDEMSLMSLLGRLTVRHRFERVVQPVASITLMRLFPLERVRHPRTPRAFANGQFLLFRRRDYDAIGGHAAVRDDLLEDLAFARAMQRSGHRIGVFLADEMLEVSMYDSLGAFRAGWRRILIESCHRNVHRLRKNGARIAAAGLGPPILHLAALAWLWSAAPWAPEATESSSLSAVVAATLLWALIAQGVALAVIYRRLGVGVGWTLAFPLGAVVIARECFRGAGDLLRGRPIRWGGREYVITPRTDT